MPIRVRAATVPPDAQRLTVLPADAGGRVDATPYRDGPLVVRGRARVLCEDGSEICTERPATALCRCGKSGAAPLCDGTHKAIGFRAPGRSAPDVTA